MLCDLLSNGRVEWNTDYMANNFALADSKKKDEHNENNDNIDNIIINTNNVNQTHETSNIMEETIMIPNNGSDLYDNLDFGDMFSYDSIVEDILNDTPSIENIPMSIKTSLCDVTTPNRSKRSWSDRFLFTIKIQFENIDFTGKRDVYYLEIPQISSEFKLFELKNKIRRLRPDYIRMNLYLNNIELNDDDQGVTPI